MHTACNIERLGLGHGNETIFKDRNGELSIQPLLAYLRALPIYMWADLGGMVGLQLHGHSHTSS